MPKWLKVTLIVCGSLFLLFLIGGGITALIFMNSEQGKTIIKDAKQLAADSEKTAEDVNVVAAKGSLQLCIDEGKVKLDKCTSVLCYVQVKLFLKTCLAAVGRKGRSEFCHGVPKEMEKMVEWDLQYCERYKPKSAEEHEVCGRMLAQEIFNFCQMPDDVFDTQEQPLLKK